MSRVKRRLGMKIIRIYEWEIIIVKIISLGSSGIEIEVWTREITHLIVALARSKASLCGSGLSVDVNGEWIAGGEWGECIFADCSTLLLLLLLWHIFQRFILWSVLMSFSADGDDALECRWSMEGSAEMIFRISWPKTFIMYSEILENWFLFVSLST